MRIRLRRASGWASDTTSTISSLYSGSNHSSLTSVGPVRDPDVQLAGEEPGLDAVGLQLLHDAPSRSGIAEERGEALGNQADVERMRGRRYAACPVIGGDASRSKPRP